MELAAEKSTTPNLTEGLAVQAGAKGGVPSRFDDPEIVGEQGPGARGRDHAEV